MRISDWSSDVCSSDLEVVSAVSVVSAEREAQAVSVSQVTFGELSEAQIAAYVATGEPMGKAGAYAIQGGGEAFIRHLSGSYSGVMGLPLFETTALLEGFGIAVGFSRPDAPSPQPSPASGRGGVGAVREERSGTTR